MNIKTNIIFSLLLSLVITGVFCYGQEKRETDDEQPIKFPITHFPPSPEASALGRFDEIPVDKSTGVVNISIPLLDLNEGGISIPITLSYHAGGIRVQDDPSWVGLGWALSTGGIISRTVRGRPDEQAGGFFTNAVKVPHYSAIYYGLYNPTLFEQTHGLLQMLANNQMEYEPDLFYYSFGDKSGSFMFGNDMKIYTIPYNGLVIEPIFDTAGVAQVDKLKGFVILDDDGVQYFFGKVLDIEGDYTEKSQPLNNGGDPLPPQHVSSWRLQKIINVFTKAEAVFHYTSYNYTTPEIFNESKTYKRLDNGLYNYEGYQVEEHTANMDLLQLNKIQMNNKTVTFTAVPEQTGNKKLTGINYSVDNSDEPEVEITFVYSNFGNVNDELSSRLKLDTLLIKTEQTNKYKTYYFDYLTNLTLPDKNSKRIDHWGFFNGAYNSSLLPNVNYGEQWLGGDANRNVNHANSGACMIKKITYPTGGYSEFEFEGNQYTRPTVPADIMDSIQVSHMIYYESTPLRYQ